METDRPNIAGKAISEARKQTRLSLRALGEATGISPATLSRIINGRQQANVAQLSRICRQLKLPVVRCFEEECASITIAERLEQLFHAAGLPGSGRLLEQVQGGVEQYRAYALTGEGRRQILGQLPEKRKAAGCGGAFDQMLQKCRDAYCRERLPRDLRAAAGSALLYFILPGDIIPDGTSGIGYLDDALVLQTVARMLDQFPPETA